MHSTHENRAGWSEGRVALLKKLWADGHSASQVAARLGGVTRCAVIAKVHRLGLPGRATTVRFPVRGGGWRKVVFKNPPKVVARKPVSPVRAILCDGLPIPPPQETDVARVSFLDLEKHHCKWPCGATQNVLPDVPIFCGASRIEGSPYCTSHTKRAFAPLPPIRPSAITTSSAAPFDNTKALSELEAA